ncbi:MAG TPA: glycosyltransferase [Niallia sp.]|nr:glycosyltransferase [Niallia sp.]
MRSRIKRGVVNILELTIYNVFNAKHRRYVKNLLSQKQKQRIKQFFKSGKKQSKFTEIEQVKYRLRNLGFTEPALADLERIYQQSQDPDVKKIAAWEMALWYANLQTEAGAKKCLEYLPRVSDEEKDDEKLRQIAILKAECLETIGRKDEAKHLILSTIENGVHPDLFLAAANTEESISERLTWINKVFDFHKLNKVHLESNDSDAYDRLNSRVKEKADSSKAKITVIIPVFNAEDVIETSLQSILTQTWTNLEVIVVDDCSSDRTVELIEKVREQDSRVKFIQAEKNGGAYVARNLALKAATGDFVTINDADDWSHPEKLEKQAIHLLGNPSIIGNTSQQARATENLKFYRRGKPGLYIFSNMSSFMFKREQVMAKIGYWDCVRFGGDSEYIKRIRTVFGENSIVELPTGPLSFQRQSESSLTGNSSFGFPGFFMGARREYLEAQKYYHAKADSLYYDFPLEKRPFPIPEPMTPGRIKGARHFDVIIVSDYRLNGGSTLSNIEEIKAQKKLGLKTGIIQLERYDFTPPNKPINSKVRDLIDGDKVQLIVYGEQVTCDLLIVRYPPILQEHQRYVPSVDAKHIRLIVNQTPMSNYGESGVLRFDIETANNRLKDYFGKEAIWYPIGPLVRSALTGRHKEQMNKIHLSDDNWANIINLEEWQRNRPLDDQGRVITIGRHSRDQDVKWPENKNELLSVYPDSSKYQVKILGGAKTPEKILGNLPSNWKVFEFGEISPKEFLEQLDVFVYYTHSNWIESFGRVILEAMAAGVPVILPNVYQELFGDAALYAEPVYVKETIEKLMEDNGLYHDQIQKGFAYVREHFSYHTHEVRIKELLSK